MNLFTKTIFVTALLLSATPSFASCDELMSSYTQKLSLPFDNFTDHGLRKCVELQQVNPSNLAGFVAATFYDNSLAVRKTAMGKLENYQCDSEKKCEAFFQLLDGHIKATVLTQTDIIAKRAERLRERTKKVLPVKEKAMVIYPARHISITIPKDHETVSAFLGKPENFTKWAAGLSSTLTKAGDHWLADSPMGKIKISFSPTNAYGVADHDVTLPDGKEFHNPLRVLRNGTGSEVVFTLYRMPGVSDQEYEKDARTILKDLEKLRSLF